MTTTPMQTKDTVRNGENVTQLGQTIHAIRHNPDIAQFKFRARNQWDTGGHNQATVHTFYGACQEMEHKQTFQFEADEPPVLLGVHIDRLIDRPVRVALALGKVRVRQINARDTVLTYKCIVLFGQVYHPAGPGPGSPLINSCVWAIPEWRAASGFHVRLVEQGKEHLTQEEIVFTPRPVGFRPAQWIVEYRWDSSPAVDPLRLSASVCYDATDLALAADLKSRSDLYVVCALNRDVGAFDRMSEGLHYHMYQGMIVVNNGQYGGSSFYMPFSQSYHRQVLHLHGQPQATIAFAEITPQKLINRPSTATKGEPEGVWKAPPANPT